MLQKFIKDEAGTTAIEYGLIITVLSLAIVAGISGFGNGMSNMFQGYATTLDNTSTS